MWENRPFHFFLFYISTELKGNDKYSYYFNAYYSLMYFFVKWSSGVRKFYFWKSRFSVPEGMGFSPDGRATPEKPKGLFGLMGRTPHKKERKRLCRKASFPSETFPSFFALPTGGSCLYTSPNSHPLLWRLRGLRGWPRLRGTGRGACRR